ncbi:hypothetical protein BDW62DRAFT_204484 [Aspergillus aurantiobrunneus]
MSSHQPPGAYNRKTSKMHLLQLPLEVLRAILAELVSLRHEERFTQLHVSETFARQAQVVLCSSPGHWLFGKWQPLVNDYICAWALAPTGHCYYAFRTVRRSTDWAERQLFTAGNRQQICKA